MKKIMLLTFISFLVSNCTNDDDAGIDCALIDPVFSSLYIKFVDANGNNLIENETIDPDEILLENGFGFRFNPPEEFAAPEAEIRVLDNTLALFIPNESIFQYSLDLGGGNRVTLDFTAERTEIECNLVYYTPTSVTNNDKTLALEEVFTLVFLSEVEL